jgi:hypothetical protein
MLAEMYLLHVETLLRMRAETDAVERRVEARFVPIRPTRNRNGRAR